MKKFWIVPGLVASLMSGYAIADDLDDLTFSTMRTCVSLSDGVKFLLKDAKFNTGITAVGTLGAGVALGAGVVENKVIKDKQKAIEDEVSEEEDIEYFNPPLKMNCDETNDWDDVELIYEETENGGKKPVCLVKSRNNKLKREMTAGDDSVNKKIRTVSAVKVGGLAASFATNAANVALALTNKSGGSKTKDYKEACPAAIKELSDMMLRNKVERTSESGPIGRAQRIIDACRGFENVDWKKIDNPAIWSAVASGVAAGTAVGGIVSTTKMMDESDIDQQQQVNKKGNAWAGASMAAGAAATILNASQISAIKQASRIADKCEKVGMEVWQEIENGGEAVYDDDDGEGGGKRISVKRG